MRKPLLLALVALAAGAGIVDVASAKDRYDRREERRQAVVVGAVAQGVSANRAEDRYRECMRDSRYDEDCARQRHHDENEARRKGRRTAVTVGIIN
jgi:hypothetical protein